MEAMLVPVPVPFGGASKRTMLIDPKATSQVAEVRRLLATSPAPVHAEERAELLELIYDIRAAVGLPRVPGTTG